jgi:hypothetical protein
MSESFEGDRIYLSELFPRMSILGLLSVISKWNIPSAILIMRPSRL